MWEPSRDFAFLRLPTSGTRSIVAFSGWIRVMFFSCEILWLNVFMVIRTMPHVMVLSSDGYFYSYSIDLERGGECSLMKQYRLASFCILFWAAGWFPYSLLDSGDESSGLDGRWRESESGFYFTIFFISFVLHYTRNTICQGADIKQMITWSRSLEACPKLIDASRERCLPWDPLHTQMSSPPALEFPSSDMDDVEMNDGTAAEQSMPDAPPPGTSLFSPGNTRVSSRDTGPSTNTSKISLRKKPT